MEKLKLHKKVLVAVAAFACLAIWPIDSYADALNFLAVTPDTLYFTAWEGGANPDADIFNVSETGGGAIAFNLTETSTWFDLDKTGGTTPEDVEVSVDISGLTADTYFDSVTVSSGEADNSPIYEFISLEVLDSAGYTFTVDSIAAFPGDQVVVPVECSSQCDLYLVKAWLEWSSNYLTLDSVSFADSWLDFFPIKVVTIDNNSNLVIIECKDSLVAPGAGNFVNLHFSVDAGTPAGFYDIVRQPPYSGGPVFNPTFKVSCAPYTWIFLEPQFTPGGIEVILPRIPTLTEWGLIIFCVLLVGWMAWVIVRRRKKVMVGI